ncbi:MAG: glycosyltransferase family 39 protein [Kiritimatiellae bacterium]|nr:glycosyltransferase family 39 protein [Kiritimatiellia bacterium]
MKPRGRGIYQAGLILVLLLAVMTRGAGLWRGTESGREYSIHPDEAKQIMALDRYLKGNYAWVIGNLFYDGYPYGLSHVDEWLIRGTAPAIQGICQSMVGMDGRRSGHTLEKPDLFRVARLLRLLYSLLAAGLLVGILRMCGVSRAVCVWAFFLLAVAPLPVSAMHAATGDTGVDLFAICALWLLARNARFGHWSTWLGAALATGCAFACKYQGALAGIAPAIFLLTAGLPAKTSVGRYGIGRVVLALLGFIAGVVLLTPAIVILPHPTLRNIWLNFEFIRNYHTSPAFRNLSGLEQMMRSISNNFVPVISGVGWSVAALAVAAWGASMIVAWRNRAHPDLEGKRRRAFEVALTGMPILALLISLLGKPEIQLIHFSWLQAPLIAAAALGVTALARRARRMALAAGLIAAFELGSMARNEHFFWARAGHGEVVNLAHKITFKQEYLRDIPRSAAISVFLEESAVAPFRNREAAITLPEGEFWGRVPGSPLPSQPAPLSSPWLYTRAPALPRNLRSWIIERNRWTERHLVFDEPPACIRMGLRSGALPARVEIQTGAARTNVTLMPHQPAIVDLPVHAWASRSTQNPPKTAWLARIRTRSVSGLVVTEFLPDQTAMEDFLLWSGNADAAIRPGAVAERLEALGMRPLRLRHWESEPGEAVHVSGRARRPTLLSRDPLWLPAGAYMMRLYVRASAPGARARLRLSDLHPGTSPEWAAEVDVPGEMDAPVQISFTKPLAPYDAHLQIQSLDGDLEVTGWSIESDAERIVQELRHWELAGAPPSWCSTPPAEPGPPLSPVAAWAPGVELLRCEMDHETSRHGLLRGRVDVRLTRPPGWGERKRFFFIHGLDESGRIRLVIDLPLIRALGDSDHEWPSAEWNTNCVPPGEYRLYMGMYNPETLQRDRIVSDAGGLLDRENRIFIGRLRVTE